MIPRTATVVIITLNRPDCVRRCLECLQAQTRLPDQIVVVDSSPDSQTRVVMEGFPGVRYLRNETGIGRMTTSRNIAIRVVDGDVVAFLDDDAFAHPQWLEHLLSTYASPDIGAVGGRALNNVPGEATNGVGEIGRVRANGTLTGNFGADPGQVIQVDHIIGCNMSFRREVLAALGGFREDYPGISGLREDTDMSLRVGRLGYRLMFNPRAVVDHLGAPQAYGKRFDSRYHFYGAQNHCILLIRNYGWRSPLLVRYLFTLAVETLRESIRRLGGACVRPLVIAGGTAAGIARSVWLTLGSRSGPIRTDAEGKAIAEAIRSRESRSQSQEPASADS